MADNFSIGRCAPVSRQLASGHCLMKTRDASRLTIVSSFVQFANCFLTLPVPLAMREGFLRTLIGVFEEASLPDVTSSHSADCLAPLNDSSLRRLMRDTPLVAWLSAPVEAT